MKRFLKVYSGRMRSSWLMILIFLILIMISGCEKNDPDNNLSKYTIYTVGQYYDNGWKGCYWKGLERNVLNGDLVSISVNDIFVSEGNVYVSGHYNRGSLKEIPCYWKNNDRIDLAGGSDYQAYTCAVYVDNGVVYTAGRYYNGIRNIPCYWANTTRTDITDYPNSLAEITDIRVLNGTVYLSGKYSVPGSTGPNTWQACYWKNGVRNDLPAGNSASTSIYVSNNTVFAGGGYDPDAVNSTYHNCYWENGTKKDISPAGNITDIFVSDGSVYTSGDDGDKPCYWKGTGKTVLSGTYRANSVFVKDGDVFTTGYYINEKDSRRPHIPCFWINTGRYDLPVTGDPLDSKSNNALSVFVE